MPPKNPVRPRKRICQLGVLQLHIILRRMGWMRGQIANIKRQVVVGVLKCISNCTLLLRTALTKLVNDRQDLFVKLLWAAEDQGKVEAVVGPYKLYDTSFHTLKGNGWLSDEEPIHQLSAVVAGSLLLGKFQPVRKRKFPVEKKSVFVLSCPVCAHWILVIVHISKRTLVINDPLSNEDKYEQNLAELEELLEVGGP
ncbi:uncharacterized protein LOC130922906 isoform X2 [Corythoichthys intestinalis]|uniref:uncharacterized protein LOC130905408 isoform X2 n=1 Tax=Corythoichthys intestinalis TaxID=161448 RepID=UPI0025A66F1D|nr:uncharacterized protein LOC130905408 isoform X2 [Corythoichthys intestinalis]XP_057704152.1 uncharacterized protein LOC130922906 isoform X2 [Corythoichthys intestinalis]